MSVVLVPELRQQYVEQLSLVNFVITALLENVDKVDEVLFVCQEPINLKHANLYLRPAQVIVTDSVLSP